MQARNQEQLAEMFTMLETHSNSAVARHFGISRERIRQIINRHNPDYICRRTQATIAAKKLKAAVKAEPLAALDPTVFVRALAAGITPHRFGRITKLSLARDINLANGLKQTIGLNPCLTLRDLSKLFKASRKRIKRLIKENRIKYKIQFIGKRKK